MFVILGLYDKCRIAAVRTVVVPTNTRSRYNCKHADASFVNLILYRHYFYNVVKCWQNNSTHMFIYIFLFGIMSSPNKGNILVTVTRYECLLFVTFVMNFIWATVHLYMYICYKCCPNKSHEQFCDVTILWPDVFVFVPQCQGVLIVEIVWQVIGVVWMARYYTTCNAVVAKRAVLGK